MNINELCMSCFGPKAEGEFCGNCGFNEGNYEAAAHHLPVQSILAGRYLVGKVIGEGGFGITYIGYDLNLEIKVAIKEYYPTGCVTRESVNTKTVHSYTGENGEFFEKGRTKFLEEAKTLAKYNNYPGVVSVRDFFMENQTSYIVMEYIEGTTLKDYLLSQGGKIPTPQLFAMMLPVLQSLGKIHQTGVIHRDISPDNIMIDDAGQIKLVDFGAARDFTESGNKSLSVMLKPGYAPEEQYRSRGVQGPWTDVYALCATIYRCITGQTPMESNERILEDGIQLPSQLGADIKPYEEAALMKGMAVLQRNRYQSVLELVADLYPTEAHLVEQTERTQFTTQNFATPPVQPVPEQPIHTMQGAANAPVQPAMNMGYQTPPTENKSDKKKFAIILIVILVLCSLIGFVLFSMFSGDSDDEKEDDKKVEDVVDDEEEDEDFVYDEVEESTEVEDSTDSSGLTSSTEDTTTEEETAGTFNASVEEMVIYDANDVVITVTGMTYDDDDTTWGSVNLNLLIENNGDSDVKVSSEYEAVNGFMLYGSLYQDVGAGKKANTSLGFYLDSLAELGIEEISDISFSIKLYDPDTYDTIDMTDLIVVETDYYGVYETEFEYEGIVIYEQDGIKIMSNGLVVDDYWDDTYLELYIENNSDTDISVTIEDFYINDYTCYTLLYADIPASYKSVEYPDIYDSDIEENNITTIETIELNFEFLVMGEYKTISETSLILLEFE